MIRCLLFDVVGTLIRVREPVGTTYARFAGEAGAAVDAALLENAFEAAFAAAPPLVARPPDTSGRWWWRELVRNALTIARAEVRGFDRYFESLYAYYGEPAAWELYPEVNDVLGLLRSRGLSLGVVSNFDSRLPRLLDRLGLTPWFDCVTYSTESGAAKPAAAIFARALERHRAVARDTVHVGDSMAADVAGARAAGLRAILLDRNGRRPWLPAGVRRVGSLAEVPAVVESWHD